MTAASQREASFEVLGAFVSAVHSHIEARNSGGEPSEDGADPRIHEFLEKHFGPGYERLPRAAFVPEAGRGQTQRAPKEGSGFDSNEKIFTFSEKDIAQHLPADMRKMFLELSEEERKFLLTAEKKYQAPYGTMSITEQTFFRGLKVAHKNAYVAMNAEERAFFQTLEPVDRGFYLVLGSGFRTLLRQLPPEALTRELDAHRKAVAAAADRPAMDLARELAPDLLGKQAASDVRQQAQRILVNYLSEHPGDSRTARIGTFQTLIETHPSFFDGVLREVGERLANAQKENANAPDYGSHLMRARHWIQNLASQLVHPEFTRESVVQGLAEAVIVSAQFTATYLPQKRTTTGDTNLLLRRPIMG